VLPPAELACADRGLVANVFAVGHRIHDDEPDTGEAIVRTLLAAECPHWSGRSVEYLLNSGTDNAMWRVRVGDAADVVVRLPRRPNAAEKVAREAELQQRLSPSPLASVVSIPRVLHVGEPHEVFPHRWSVFGWLHGSDAWSARAELGNRLDGLATDLAGAVLAIRELPGDLPAEARGHGKRGGPIGPLVQRLERWLDDPRWHASELIDVARVRHLAAEALDVEDSASTCFAHGDLIPGNLLVRSGRLSAILDWGGAGYGDPAQDLAPAWSVFHPASRQLFRRIVQADDADWVRARTIELEHAVGGVLYYVPRKHALGDVMATTLARILGEE
jgi:aminoglycoside phosphotransferase (APT) family kinase protein